MASALAVAVFRRLPRPVGMFLVRRATPKYTLGVQVIVQRPDGRILLVEQPYRARPFLPGGTLKRGEDVLAGARREMLEETGLQIPLVGLGTAQVRPAAAWVTFYALGRPDDGQAESAVARGPEVTGLVWVDPDRLPTVDPGVTAALSHVRRGSAVLISPPSQTPPVAADGGLPSG